MTQEEFITELSKLNINLTESQIKSLEEYKTLLQEYNQKFNLTALTKDEDIYLKHFYDSLTLTKAADFTIPQKVLDIGTGAGFPGLVLKIVFPNLDITLIDSNHKKITFLETVINKLNLKNITCLNTRIEDFNSSYRDSFDIITSRAVAHLRILSELAIPYLKVNGLFIPMKGLLNNELNESLSTLKTLNSNILEKLEFTLPKENSERTILKITKTTKTNPIYPRPYSKIIKKSL